VLLVIATDGRRGSFEHKSEVLVPLRMEETRRAARVLGAEEPILLSHPDMELDRLAPGKLREEFIRLIRQHRPEVAIAQDPFVPYENHPDHRAVAWAASDALHYAHLPLVHSEHLSMGLQPHFVAEKYFYGDFPPGTPLQPRSVKSGIERRGICHIVVNISSTIDIKMAALAEHKSQMTFLVEEVLRQAAMLGPSLPDLKQQMIQAAGNPAIAMAWFLKAQAAEIGGQIGVSYGEAFRYERFHPVIESFLKRQRD
jgi:LmbE family N-acetylglucosaminyl deacetylase